MNQKTSRTSRLAAFRDLYLDGGWSGTDGETVSGTGSTLEYTQSVRHLLPVVFDTYGITSVVDAPCGDFNWFKEIPLPDVDYVGVDIVPEMIASNSDRYSSERRSFLCADATCDPLPKADLFFCRDLLLHIPWDDCTKVMHNAMSSRFEWFIFSSYDIAQNSDVDAAFGYRPLNLQRPPFNLPAAEASIPDFIDGFRSRHLLLWNREQVADAVAAL